MYLYEAYLAHHGILGMHWGIRRYQPYPGEYRGDGKFISKNERKVINRTQKLAKKDAKRYADAKMYYGEGAGVRRRLLKAELDKKRKDPVYKEAFDAALEKTNYALSAKKAKTERGIRDAVSNTKSLAKRYVVPAAFAAASIYYASHKDQVDAFVLKKMEMALTFAHDADQKKQAAEFLKKMGL